MESLEQTLTDTASATAAYKPALHMSVNVLPAINYALQHNGAVPVQSVTITNPSEQDVENAVLKITSLPEFFLPFTCNIAQLPAGKSVTLKTPNLVLNTDYLAGLTEKITAAVQAELLLADTSLTQCSVQTAVFAFDEWHGLGVYPEFLVSFVTPNHPHLAKIIARATEYLGQWTGDTSMDGYQSQDPNRVLQQAAAIFTALKEQAIAYVVPPASFEKTGQRIRLCDAVLQKKLGTCLDLTLLYAACLEAVGLHPLLITTPGHIFTGLWLEDRMFPECVQDDSALITKRLADGVNEIAVVETTCITTKGDFSFDDARSAGEQNLLTQDLGYILDVRRARMSNIFPLPQKVRTESGWEIRHDASFRRENLSAPQKLGDTIRVSTDRRDENIPKKLQWERKLLDLGMRNNLINLRLTKTQLPLLTESLDDLENALADGSDFTILPKPTEWKMEEFSFEALHKQRPEGLLQAEFENKRLRSICTEGELNKTIKGLYRTAKSALEENGANTLYLALGMLQWFENKRSTKARYAPIILLPIEMVRKSAAQGYVIRLRDDEPQMNITLLEKLKQDFGIGVDGVDPLPADEHGVDIRKVLTIMRQAVMEQPHWDVLEVASIGIFSFSQFVMWNDIRNRSEDLMRNKIVRSLIDGKLAWEAKPLEIGRRVNEENVLLPMPADASQLYAIRAACGGRSFVLHGPPGTGKSQTITSLIANALARGKRVLFVAEKMAALEVVQKRLEAIGIGPFCLELHSNKSKKRDVLEQLRKASEVTKTQTAEEYAQRAQQIASMRAQLDAYATQLHKPLTCGSDLYTLINEYEGFKDAPDIRAFDPEFLKKLDGAYLEKQALAVERLVAAAREVGHPKGHPLRFLTCWQYSQSLRAGLVRTTEAYSTQLQTMQAPVKALCAALEQKTPQSMETLQQLSDIAKNLASWYEVPVPWVKAEAPDTYFDAVIRMAKHFQNANKLEQALLQDFDTGFLKQNGQQLFQTYAQTAAKWFLPKAMGIRKLVKTVNVYAKNPVTKHTLRDRLVQLRDYQQQSAAAKKLFGVYGKDLAGFYKEKATDWSRIIQLATTAKESAAALHARLGSYEFLHSHGAEPTLQKTVVAVWKGYAPLAKAKKEFDTLLGILQYTKDNWLDTQLKLCRTILEHQDSLRLWTAYMATARDAKNLGLANVVASYREGAQHDQVFLSYKKAILQGLIHVTVDGSKTLTQFSGAVFNKKIEQYKRMDQQWSDLSRQEAYCRLASKVPNFTAEASHSSELGILQRCIKSGGRGTSIRKLFDQIPNLLPRLCPCMLMSPISAAQYLDPKREPFDIVVFDEASQMPTCKAVGVLARGKDAVVVGDPKQMPPTSFFATNTVDEENLEGEDMESILDDCLALNMPQSHLLWHYRSRHESLIAFSNSQFYENKLFTFPSVNDRVSKVRLAHVDGVFDRGNTRTNKAEAQAVVEEIRRRSRDPELSGLSLGVVTFNVSQQHLIDDLLNEACKQDPELEKWAYGSEEPLFIKNLENVQGDERDVILFSIGYGPDKDGEIYMNFGPLNRDGGWRRLNVAISRARHEMVVFTALHADQIDLNRTKSEGVAALRSFLEYAEGRDLAMDAAAVPVQQAESGIAQSICRALAEAGYDTDLSVGRSEYRVDIGVVDPNAKEQYLLGILLDGSGYGAAKTTRDRELAQVQVLTGLGWHILRIWSMDWWDNSKRELDRILALLKQIQQQPKPQPKPPVTQPQPTAEATSEVQQMVDHSIDPHQILTQEDAAFPAPRQPEAPVKKADLPIYRAAVLSQQTLSADNFLEPRYQRGIQSKINAVIAAEAPVSLSVLCHRVAQSYGITRVTGRIQTHMRAILRSMHLKATAQGEAIFYWREDQDPSAYIGYRKNGEGDNHRDVRDVPVQEVANAVYAILYDQVSMGQEDLLRETAKKLGYARVGGNVQAILESGLRYAKTKGGITAGANGTYILTPKGTARAEAAR